MVFDVKSGEKLDESQLVPGGPPGEPMDEETRALISKGFVPHRHTGPFGSGVEWERPTLPGLNWPAATVLIAVLTFILLNIWGSPW